MSKESLEHISSLMDGELSRETGLFMTRRLSSDKELSSTWQRYHLIRDCIRQPGGRSTFMDFTECVKSALAEEEAQEAPAWNRGRWMKPLAGFAVAASVALMAIVAIGPGTPVTGPAANLDDTAINQPFDSPNPLNAVPISQPASFNADTPERQRAANPRLSSYLVRHNQLAGTAGRQGFVSFVPIIVTRSPDAAAEEAPEAGPAEAAVTPPQDTTESDPGQP